MIECIKIAKYELRPRNEDIYSYLRELGLQTNNPPSLAAKSIAPENNIIYCSPLKRAVECVDIKPESKLLITDCLREIPFDMADLCSVDEFAQHGSQIVRSRFRESFIKDTLPKSRNEIFFELKTLLREAILDNQAVTFISHSFRLKILQAYIKTKGRLEAIPELINDYLLDEEKTFGFGERFIITDADLTPIKPLLL